MRFGATCWAESFQRLPRTFPWVIRDSSAGAATEMYSLVLCREMEKSWVKISVRELAEGTKGRVTQQGVSSDILLTFCLVIILSIWSTKFWFSDGGSEDSV